MGEPVLLPLKVENDCFNLGGAISGPTGLFADCGRLSWGGDSMKHSPNDMDVELDSLLQPAPKRKGGTWLSELREGKLYPL